MALRPLRCFLLLVAAAAEVPTPALRGPAAAPAAAGVGPGTGAGALPQVACVCPLATDECSCTRAEAARNVTAEEAKLEQTLAARAKTLSAWWGAQNATTRLTRVWSGPMSNESTGAELPSVEQTTDLWVGGWGGGWGGGGGPGAVAPGAAAAGASSSPAVAAPAVAAPEAGGEWTSAGAAVAATARTT